MAFKRSESKRVTVEFSPQQIKASEEIRDNFSQGIVRYNILLAQMQSGKTETYLLTAWEMVRAGKVNNVVVFSGNSEIYLKEQLTTTLRGTIFRDKYEAYLRDKEQDPKQCLRDLEEWAQFDSEQPKFQILWGTEMKKYTGLSEETLFIWEESHYAQTLKQSPDKFLQRMGISPDGKLDSFSEKRNYMLSISATPFSELSDSHHLDQNKRVVFMLPGNNYNSVKRMRDTGRIKAYPVLSIGLNTALSNAEASRPVSYAIIRVTPKSVEETEEAIRQHNGAISKQQQWKVYYFDSLTIGKEKEDGDRVWREMKNEPQQNTIILIRGKCRMGHDLSKTYLAFVMETSKSPNTDTLLQGLLGRACGYPRSAVVDEDNIYRVDVYLNEKIVKSKEIDRYVKMVDTVHDGIIEVLPKKGKNLSKNKEITGIPIIPIRVTRSVVNNDKTQVIKDIVTAMTDNRNVENKNSDAFYQEVREKIIGTNESKQLGNFKMFYMDDGKKTATRNGKKAFEILHAFERSEAKNFGAGCGIDSENTEINVWVIKKVNGMDNTHIFITSNVHYMAPSDSLITETTKKEIFACQISDTKVVVANGGMPILFPVETASSVQAMKTQLCIFINLSKQYNTTNQISSLWDVGEEKCKPILITPEVFLSLQKKGQVYELIKQQFGLTISLTKPRGRMEKSVKESGYIKLESISW